MVPLGKVAVLGAGSWGTAVAAICARVTPTVLWARRPELALAVASDHHNREYLTDFMLPESLQATSSLAGAVEGAGVVIVAVPSHGFRQIVAEAARNVSPGARVLSLTKGLEQHSLKRMTEVIVDEMHDVDVGVLTGPNLAREVADDQPSASVVASTADGMCCELQKVLTTRTFRVYTNSDVVGCEMAGALKNVIAIAAGMSDGMGFGDNSRAALVTRGLAELTRLGVAMGGRPLTFSGLAGMGDLVATCASRHSRNRYVGEQLGRGETLDDIVASMNMVAEGVKTAPSVIELAERYGVEVPIAEQVCEVLAGRRTAREVIPALMEREMKAELHGIEGA
jgi:glycerol-3-phosphate dehydrogenase (NAD(P)+)